METRRDGTQPLIRHGRVFLRAAERHLPPLSAARLNDRPTSRTRSLRAP